MVRSLDWKRICEFCSLMNRLHQLRVFSTYWSSFALRVHVQYKLLSISILAEKWLNSSLEKNFQKIVLNYFCLKPHFLYLSDLQSY